MDKQRGRCKRSANAANGGYRGDAARADADFVRDLAQRWDLPYSIDSRDVTAFARQHKLSIEEAARQVRYGFLLDVALAQGSEQIDVSYAA